MLDDFPFAADPRAFGQFVKAHMTQTDLSPHHHEKMDHQY